MAGQNTNENKINLEKLREMLSKYNLSELARRSGISYSTIIRFKRNISIQDMTAVTAYKLATAMGMDTGSFIKEIYNIK